MNAYKFLADGAVSPFAGFRWPVGAWVEAGSADVCRLGIHACRIGDLPFWLGPELWEIELDGDVVAHPRKVVAPRGRLVRRVEAWNEAARQDFGASVLSRTRTRFGAVAVLGGYVGDIERHLATGRVPLAAFAAARAAERAGGPIEYERERSRQAAWLADRLSLGTD
ncbi:MAG: hypothetical protein E6G50_00415 [Actinobacteria bacterium]|nr:MAG: hypothetical protein E6G50_00415 [Actinomycetota bacterium]